MERIQPAAPRAAVDPRSRKSRSAWNGVLLLALLLPAVPALQSCGQRNGAETSAKPEIDPLEDSLGALDREIEELKRRKRELDQEMEELKMSARWEVKDAERLAIAELYNDEATTTPPGLVAALNRHRETQSTLPNPVMEFREQRGRTVYVSLRHGERLTQQMGSAGAAQYLAEATFTLTSLPGVDSVDFEFPEGDHARPGAYTRGSWAGVFKWEEPAE